MMQLRLVLLLVGVTALVPRSAHAYDPKTHSKIVETAVNAMQDPLLVPIPQAGSVNGIPFPAPSQADFDQYLTVVRAAPGRLTMMGTGLPKKIPGSATSITPLPFVNDGNETYPFSYEYKADGPPDPRTGQPTLVPHAPQCDTYPTDNLSDVSQFRISEFLYLPRKQTAAPCALEKIEVGRQKEVLPAILGWHATSIDYHIDDSVMWFKPTNAGAQSIIKDLAREGASAVIGALILPFYCIWHLLSDGDCDTDKPFALANSINPVDFIDGFLPGFGDIRSDAFTGLWHFIHIDENPGDFNNYPGMYYPEAGPSGYPPGAVDVALIAATDISGLSLNAYASKGDDIYGDEDDIERFGPIPWMAYSMAHVEFSPLDNLANYGWKKWLNSGAKSAEGLAWPLHAIGDASEPHHVAGTTSYGHRPMEAGVEGNLDIFFPATAPDQTEQQKRILSASYWWWAVLQRTVDSTHPNGNIETFIENLAIATRDNAGEDNGWAYQDAMSVLSMTVLDAPLAELAYSGGLRVRVKNLLEMSSAATVAFLAFAGERANDRGNGITKCPSGQSYKILEGCVIDPVAVTAWPLNGCAQWQEYCQSDADCGSPGAQVCVDSCCLYTVD